MKFYPADWRADQSLRVCSLAARGLWIECMCIMHEATPYGHLVLNGHPVTNDQLSALAGTSPAQISALLGELETAGVFSRTGKDVIYSRRMTRDEKKAKVSAKNGKNGGNPTLCKTKDFPAWDNTQDKVADKAQKPEAIVQKEEGVVDAGERDPIRTAMESIGAWNDPNCRISGGRVLEWIKAGSDLDLDILPTLDAVMAKARAREGPAWMPTSMTYFDKPVAKAMANRTKPVPGGNHDATGNRNHQSGRIADAETRRRRTAESISRLMAND